MPSSYGPQSRFLSLHWPGRRAGRHFSNLKVLLKGVGARRLRPSIAPSRDSIATDNGTAGNRKTAVLAKAGRQPVRDAEETRSDIDQLAQGDAENSCPTSLQSKVHHLMF